MNKDDTSTIERRTGSHKLIEDLIQGRTSMLSLYTQLASKQPLDNDKNTLELLELFCESLIDYTANAHFRLYEHISEKKERRRRVIEAADQTYPKIAVSTETILDFNDKYDTQEHSSDNLVALKNDLSRLGELLETRIALEDQVIRALTTKR